MFFLGVGGGGGLEGKDYSFEEDGKAVTRRGATMLIWEGWRGEKVGRGARVAVRTFLGW